jgi:hypothetical protein
VKKALFLAVLLAAGAVLARHHVANQRYYPVAKLASSDGYIFHVVLDRAETRGECGAANERLLEPLKASCKQCEIEYARCERELGDLELRLLTGEPVPLHVVTAPGLRMAIEGPAHALRRDCEYMAAAIVSTGAAYASCAFPGTPRKPG